MAQSIRILAALLIAALLLIMGNGLQNTFLAVRGELEAFPIFQIGLLLSAYSLGFIFGCQVTPRLVKRVGHVRTFTALASLASASALAHAIFLDAGLWIVLRIVTGFALAGLQMIIESWINEKATNENRGRVLALYRIVDLGATTCGQLLLVAADPSGFVLFALISILISLSLVPVALTTVTQPAPINAARLDVPKLYRLSPLAVVCSLSVGLANGAFWAVGAVYIQRLGFGVEAVSLFMSGVVLAGALAQWPLGFVSDLMDRRYVIIAVSAGATVSSALLFLMGAAALPLVLAAGAFFGLFAMPLFGLAVAHANDWAAPGDYVETSGGLFLMYGVGAVIGPLLGPLLMGLSGPSALFLYTGVVYAGLTVFGLYRLARRAGPPEADRETYVPVPRSTPVVFELDPRTPEADENAADSPPLIEGSERVGTEKPGTENTSPTATD